jgi:pimeloyl-ACP methyl ester carboxylesterase
MSTFESIIIIVCAAVAATVLGNLIFSAFAEWKNPPIGKFVECDGIRIHYLERGNVDAPAVVLLHGNGTMIQDFMLSGLVDLLAREYRVICFDRPGFGYTSRPRRQIWTADEQGRLLQDALNQLAVRNPVVLGHSWGTLVAIALACRADYPVAGLVLASGYYFPTVRFDVWMLSAPAIPVLGDLIRYTVAPIISAVLLPSTFRTLFSPRAVPTSFRTQFPRSLMLRPKQLRAAAEESALLVPTACRSNLGIRASSVPSISSTGRRTPSLNVSSHEICSVLSRVRLTSTSLKIPVTWLRTQTPPRLLRL